jgi:carbon-monoxide dehydrogenase large subunit/6-hydroxypseudooxynicotine dehydrogenase subunit gamma
MTGEATRIAAAKLRDKALAAAASLLQSTPAALDVVDGKVIVKGAAQGASVSLAEIARALAPGKPLVGDGVPGLSAEGWFESAHMTYPYGTHIAVVRLDRDSGAVTVERYLVGYDIGRAVNPMLVEGQIVGGVAQGLGGALFEEFIYDARGEPLAVSFADYLMPTAREIPPVTTLITEDAPSPLNTLGVKGAGEGGANAVGAAIAAAIDDALGKPGAVRELPVTPPRLRALVKPAKPA